MNDFEWTEQDSINLTAKMVAHDGHRMALRGAEREAALRMMAALGLDRKTIADRLRMTVYQVGRAARYYGITLLPTVPPQHWTVAIYEPSKHPDRVRERAHARRQSQGVAA